jgi:pyruvate/2-oxoglutarate dehydrogenase complex dihydrolipoamide dehydrogenase (E3) component
VPSKALIACFDRLHAVQTASEFGINIAGPVTVDFPAVVRRMRKIRAESSVHDSVACYSRDFCKYVFLGQAEFTSANTLTVAGTELNFKKAMIATGASALLPVQLAGLPYLSNANFFNLEALPRQLLVIGGGPIGVELAQSMARFGCAVTLLQKGPQILDKDDSEAAAVVHAALQRDGVTVALSAELLSVQLARSGGLFTAPFQQYTVTYRSVSSEKVTLQCEAVLVAAGRVPNVRGLGLESIGVAADLRRGVHVDDSFQSTVPNIYACGDCATPFKFTHAADWQARIAGRNMLLGRQLPAEACGSLSNLLIPAATYSDPELAHVGLTEADLKARGTQYDVYKRELSAVDRCRCEGVSEGFVKLLANSSSGQLLGATIVAPTAGDMISEITLAMQCSVTVQQLAGVIHPYPTVQEAVRQAAAQGNKVYSSNSTYKQAVEMLVEAELSSNNVILIGCTTVTTALL